jgi:hypothetical protein
MNGLVLALSVSSAAGQLVGHRRFRECTADSDCAVIPGDTCVTVPGNTGTRICMNTVTEDFCGTQDSYSLDATDFDTLVGANSGCFWEPFRQFDWSAQTAFSRNIQMNPVTGDPFGDGVTSGMGVDDVLANLNVEPQGMGSFGSGNAGPATTRTLTEDQVRGLYPCNVFPKHLYKCCNACDTIGPRNANTLFDCAAYNGVMWSDGTRTDQNRYVPTYFSNQEPRCPCAAPAVATSDADPVLPANAFQECGSTVAFTQNGQPQSQPELCCTMRKFPEWVSAQVESADAGVESHQFPHTRASSFNYGLTNGAAGGVSGRGTTDYWWQVNGWCFNPLTEKCCDDGTIYNPGLFKCCAVEGVLPISNPCQCSSNAHCKDPSRPAADQRDTECCMEARSENPSVANTAAAAHSECDRYHKFHNYAAFSLGRGVRQVASVDQSRPLNCAGLCIDKSYQICCNGAVCQAASESCCDNVCCNKFSEKCTEGAAQDDMGWLQFLYAKTNPHFDSNNIADSGAKQQAGLRQTLDNFQLSRNTRISAGTEAVRAFYVDTLSDLHMLRFTSRFFGVDTFAQATYNPTAYNLGAEKLYCTRLEEQNAHTMYLAYVWPATLLLAFTLAAGVVLSHLTKWAMRPLSLIEKVILASAVVSAVFSLPTWFSGNNYTFGIVISWAAFFTLLAVGSGLRKPVALAALVNLVVFFYMVNPFHGNIALNTKAEDGVGGDNVFTDIFAHHDLADSPTSSSTATYSASTHRIVNFAAGVQTGPADRVVEVYNSYFQLDPRLLDFRTWNPYEMYFGYATRGWTIAVGVFIMISFIALFAQVVLLTMAYFLHAHADEQKAEVESALSPAFEEPPEEVFGADPTSTGFREMDGAPLAARDESDYITGARKAT